MEREADDRRTEVVRHEEELLVGRDVVPTGDVRVRKEVETVPYTERFGLEAEHADTERVPPDDQDSGAIETLPDGSISVPLFVEELVITKRLVVRERVIIRKRTVTEERVVEADLRRERVVVEADEGVELEADEGVQVDRRGRRDDAV